MANELRNRDFDVFDPMSDFFGDFGKNFFNSVAGNQMKTDVIENEDNYVVSSELPGFKKDDIHLDYDNDTLSIHASHNLNKEDTNKEGKVLRKERTSSNVARSFYLPDVEIDQISAKYDGGILKIELPKSTQKQAAHKISIN
ncbi:Hsp20/alpha crystallin family protein [Apilactobacillus apinorum]|uniref:Hsp20/alpha crystallin family protein n=1 Tax=Apilactobacillus apinorum TaxID=1218495 RepID=A0ABP9ZHP1_9LACO|nr:Hsp20/alpha crystallin family protein [Apilactobacillus apinorum]KOY69921.1 Molecular chaperone (Small heat shock protein) [Apilactobacillus apinorum]CAI2609784.1 B807_109 Molecular chaperone (Small heat shock protein) [Apilactobacillus apinorum]